MIHRPPSLLVLIVFIACMQTPIQAASPTMKNAASQTDPTKTPDIESMIRSRNDLSRGADRANNWYIGFLVATVLVAFGAALSQFRTIMLFRKSAAVSLALEAEKDRQAGAAITDAKAEAARALQRAGEADERAAAANLEAGRANVRAGQLEQEAAALKTGAALARLATEKLRAKNIRLQTVLLPRKVYEERGDESEALGRTRAERRAEVSKHAGMRAVIRPVPDIEAQQLATLILGLLNKAGWQAEVNNEPQRWSALMVRDGVEVITNEGPWRGPDGLPLSRIPFSRAGVAARALVKLLELDLSVPFAPESIGVHWTSEMTDMPFNKGRGIEVPEDTVVILVGLRPVWEFLQAWRPEDEE